MKTVALSVLGAVGAIVFMAMEFPAFPVLTQGVLLQAAVDWTNAPTTVLGVLTALGGGIILYLRAELKGVRDDFKLLQSAKDSDVEKHLKELREMQKEKDEAMEKARLELKQAYDESNERYDKQLERSADYMEGISTAIGELAKSLARDNGRG